MAYTAPDKAAFIAAFPAFAAIDDAPYALWSARAGRIVDQIATDLGDDADLAAMLLTAHYLTLQGLGTGTEAQLAAQGASGFIRFKSGSLELERSPQAAAGAGDMASTSYGAQVWAMLRPFFAGPRIAGTGIQPDGYVPW